MSFLDRFADDGWLQIDRLFPVDLIDGLREEFERQFETLRAEQDGYRGYLRVGEGNDRLMLSVDLTGKFLDPALYANPILSRILGALLGKDFLIDSYTCVVADIGAGDQHFHRDHSPLFVDGEPDNLPPHAVTVVVPLVDLSEQTGTTKLFPRTHRGTEPGGSELPYIPRGSCFVMDYRLWHHGTANNSGARRPVLYIVYARSWFIDMLNFSRQPRINITEDALKQIAPEHRPLFRRIAVPGAIDKSAKLLFA